MWAPHQQESCSEGVAGQGGGEGGRGEGGILYVEKKMWPSSTRKMSGRRGRREGGGSIN